MKFIHVFCLVWSNLSEKKNVDSPCRSVPIYFSSEPFKETVHYVS